MTGSSARDEEKRRRLAEWRAQEQAERDEWQREFHDRHTKRYFQVIKERERHAHARERLQQYRPEPVTPAIPPYRPTSAMQPKPKPVPIAPFSLKNGDDLVFCLIYALVMGLMVIYGLVWYAALFR